MTQKIAFEFISRQFAFESGKVMFTKGARFDSIEPFETRQFHHGVVDGVLVEGPIEFDAVLVDLSVTSHTSGRVYQPLPLLVTGSISATDLRDEVLGLDYLLSASDYPPQDYRLLATGYRLGVSTD